MTRPITKGLALVGLAALCLCAAISPDAEARLFKRPLCGRRIVSAPAKVMAQPTPVVVDEQQGDCEHGDCWGKPKAAVAANYGVKLDALPAPTAKTRYLLTQGDSSHFVDRDQAVAAVQGKLPDDLGKLRLSVFGGTKQQRDEIAGDLNNSPLAQQVVYYSAAADHFSVKDSTGNPMFPCSPDRPTVYLQNAATGKVLHRQEGYAGAKDIEAIRKAVDGYDPKKDPDLRAGGGLPIPGRPLPLPAYAVAGLLGAGALLRLGQRD